MAFRRTPLYDEAVLMLHMPSIEGRLPGTGFVQVAARQKFFAAKRRQIWVEQSATWLLLL